jgi:hypothetical protein
MILGCLSLIVIQYLAYLEFDNWSYLRFLLTCWPFVMLGVAAVALAVARWRGPIATLLVSATILALGVQGLQHARTSQVFRTWHSHRRAVDFVRVLARETRAIERVLHVELQRDTSVLRGTNDDTDGCPGSDWLDRSVEWLRSRGFRRIWCSKTGKSSPSSSDTRARPSPARSREG